MSSHSFDESSQITPNHQSTNNLMTYLSQELHDARRALLNHAPSSVRDHAWISPDATNLTLRSSRTRTSDNMTQLATKSGWLLVQSKGNSRWKKQWCCVVPHTFLYLFDDPLSIQSSKTANLQEMLTCGNMEDIDIEYDDEGRDVVNPTRSKIKPNTIIDLEGYKEVQRMQTGYILELNGGETAYDQYLDQSPEDKRLREKIRPMYFRVSSPEECKEWSDSFQSHRYQSVKNEYDEILQLNNQMKHQIEDFVCVVEEEENKRKQAETETIKIRNNAQNMSSAVIQLVQQALEQTLQMDGRNNRPSPTSKSKSRKDNSSRMDMFSTSSPTATRDPMHKQYNDTHTQCLQALHDITTCTEYSTTDITTKSVETLIDFASYLAQDRMKLIQELHQTKQQLHTIKQDYIDPAVHKNVKQKLDKTIKESTKYKEKVSFLETELAQSHHETSESQRYVQTIRSSFRTRTQELEKHKDLLKDEILQYRSENSMDIDTMSLVSNANRSRDMEDTNFGLPKLTPMNFNPTSSLADIPPSEYRSPDNSQSSTKKQKNAIGPVRVNCDFSSYETDSDMCTATRNLIRIPRGKKDTPTIKSAVTDEVDQDMSIKSFSTMDNSESKDEMFQQLQAIRDANKKWYACSDITQYSTKASLGGSNKKLNSSGSVGSHQSTSKGREAEVSVFDSSTWICGQKHDEVI